MRDVFHSLVPEKLEGFYTMKEPEDDMERASLSNQQHQELAVRLATIETLVQVNAQCTRRLEIRLLGADDNPDSGIIANLHRRVQRLEEDRIKVLAGMALFLFLLQIFQHKLLSMFGL